MEFIKKLRISANLNAVLTILIGVLFCIDPYGSSSTIAVIAGAVILCNGLFDIGRYIKAGAYAYFLRSSLFTGILKCILGIFIFTHTGTMVTMFSYIFSIFIIANGITSLENAIQLARAEVSGWIVNLILAVLVIAAGAVMLFHPVGTAYTMAIYIGIILIADGVIELFTLYRMRKIGREFYRSLKYFKDEIDGNIIDEP